MKAKCFVPVTGMDNTKARDPRLAGIDINRIRLSVGYDPGGVNHFTCKTDARGYYLYVSPEHTNDVITQYMFGAGCKYLLTRVPRQSKKRAAEAIEIATERAPAMVEWCCKEYGLIVEPTEIKFKMEESA